jgi:hypothetical protein
VKPLERELGLVAVERELARSLEQRGPFAGIGSQPDRLVE